MDDNELDRLFEQAANKYVPPPPPEGAWDNFVATKLTPTERPQKNRLQSLKKWLLALFIPKTTWQLITYSLVAVIGLWLAIDQMSQPALKDKDKYKKVAIQKNNQSKIPGNNPFQGQPSPLNPSKGQDSATGLAKGVNTGSSNDRVNKSTFKTPLALNPLIAAGNKIDQGVNGQPTAGPATGIQNNIAKSAYANQLAKDSLLLNKGVARFMNKGITQNATKTVKPSKSILLTPGLNLLQNNLAKTPLTDSSIVASNNFLAKGTKKPTQVSINGKINNTPYRPSLKQNNDNQSFTGLSFTQTEGRRAGSPHREDDKNDNWQLGLLAGTNISTVKGTVSKNLGLNGGVMVQHRINSSRLSVETGLVVATMDYKVANEDFHPGGQEVSDKISNVNGTCTMLDVPVNVRYDLVRSKKSNAFISTGVSAMVMVNQDYNYYYTGQNKVTEVTKDVSGQGNNVYASTNISVGYERRFKKTAIQVAPYVKVPMGSVGYGNLSLGNVGAQISIKKDL